MGKMQHEKLGKPESMVQVILQNGIARDYAFSMMKALCALRQAITRADWKRPWEAGLWWYPSMFLLLISRNYVNWNMMLGHLNHIVHSPGRSCWCTLDLEGWICFQFFEPPVMWKKYGYNWHRYWEKWYLQHHHPKIESSGLMYWILNPEKTSLPGRKKQLGLKGRN